MGASSLDLLRDLLDATGAFPQSIQTQSQSNAFPQQQQPFSFPSPQPSDSAGVEKSPAAHSPAQSIAPSPAPEADGPTHRCSQCKQSKPLEMFPSRLTTLQPFLVCKSHSWYWTPQKRELHWAPETESTIDVVCREVEAVVDGSKATGSWIVRGVSGDRTAMVDRISALHSWVATPVTLRKSRASGPAPPRPFHYQLKSGEQNSRDKQWRLVLTLHEDLGKFVVSFKEDTGRKAGTWAKKDRKQSQSKRDAGDDGQGSSAEQSDQSFASNQPARPQRQSQASTPSVPQSYAPSSTFFTSTELRPGQTDVNAEASTSRAVPLNQRPRNSSSVAQPAPKRPRRVEPSQLPPSRPLLPNPPPPPESTRFVPAQSSHEQTSGLIFVQPPTPPRPLGSSHPSAFTQLPSSSIRTEQRRSASPSYISPLPHATPSQGRRANSQPHTFEGLTLDQLLASPYLDPPTIPLQQRTMQLNAAAYNASKGGAAIRGRATSEGAGHGGPRRSASAENVDQATQHGGQRRSRKDDGEESEEADETDLEEDEEGSSEDDGADDGGDWLTGFVKGQLHGIGGASQEEVDELESGGEGDSEGD